MKGSRLEALRPGSKGLSTEEAMARLRKPADAKPQGVQPPAWTEEALKNWSYESGKSAPMKVRRSELARHAMQTVLDALDGEEPFTEKTHKWVAGVLWYFMQCPNGNTGDGHGWLMELEEQAGISW